VQTARIAIVVGALSMGLMLRPEPAQAHHSFGNLSGFAKAREGRESITLCAPPAIEGESVIAPWNELAGWGLFRLSCEKPDIIFVSDRATWVQATYLQPFTNCRIHYASVSTRVHQHEIGHCLGFADHVPPGQLHRLGSVNAGECAGYRGVMSYCDWGGRHWFGDDDREMLVRAGYAAPVGTEERAPGSPSAPAPASRGDGIRAGLEGRSPRISLLRLLIEFLVRWR
jgi:hypothetical protein